VINAEAVHGDCLSGNYLQNSLLVGDLAVSDEDDMVAALG
jgi:hypothetical protein